MFFKEDKRGLVLNVTNKNFLVLLTRSKNPADAVGQRVMLVAVEGRISGQAVHGPAAAPATGRR